MMKENNRNNNEKILLTNVASKLRKARNLAPNVPYPLYDLTDYLASVVRNDEIAPMGMINLLIYALDDIQKERCGFTNKVSFPKELKKGKIVIIFGLSYFPLIVDKIASKKFAEEFRTLFAETFGKPQPPIDDAR